MYTLEGLLKNANEEQVEINGRWVPVRPMRFFGLWYNIKDAWAVLTGKADAFKWPEGQ